MADAGSFESPEPDSPFTIKDTYLGPRRWFQVPMERDGLRMHFAGWAYPLEGYFRALEDAGFAIQAVREPRVDDPTVIKYPSEHRWRRIPNFLMWPAVLA